MANTRIPQLPSTVLIDGSEQIEIAQSDGAGGYVSRRVSLSTVNGLSPGNTFLTGPYVVASAYALTPNARVLAGTAGQIGVTDGGAGTNITLALVTTAVVAGTYGSGSAVPVVTVDAYGRLTGVATATTSVAVGNITGLGTGVATALAVNVGTAGSVVVNGGALGAPSSGTLTNVTGLPISSGVSGLGTGVATALGVNVGTAGAVVVNGGALGTPSSGTLTNATGLPVASGISGLGAGVATFLATPSSANLKSAVTDETGSGGALVFATSPTIADPTITGQLSNTGTTDQNLLLQENGGQATGTSIENYHNSSTPATNDTPMQFLVKANSSTAVKRTIADLKVNYDDTTNASEDASWRFRKIIAGVLTSAFYIGALASGTADANAVGLPLGQASFPVTQNSSSDANTLDDYEEGSYTPSWSGNGTPPALGNGTLTGTYVKVGQLVNGQLTLTMGTTTTYGTGFWTFTVPFTMSSGSEPAGFSGGGIDVSAGTRYAFFGVNNTTSAFVPAASATGILLGAASPFTWASTDVLTYGFSYRANA